MEESKKQYVRRTQKDYSEAFKLQVVHEVENGEIGITAARKKYGIQGHATIRTWIEKYGNFDKRYQIKSSMKKSIEQELMELRQQVKLLEKKNKLLSKELDQTDKKALFFDMMIDIAEKEFNIPIRKKSLSKQSTNLENKKK